ncbi:AAA family ATPase [Chitinophaga pinensis]|uniref:AAA family ATPase n=1 Tax=Chitinophaga pinensis TaxID=79329 RepID=A0A5C6LWN2_9BACT|nr:ATP-binding protein [Chitinophaga pinensis]TWW00990.1 AAA family ATPase [Chitinophaga pinensis]
MILRFVVKNLFSFKEETEFNLFPNRTTNLPHHKTLLNDIAVLRFSAIYGANGSGKSNLIKAIHLLEQIVESGKLPSQVKHLKFKLSEENEREPISIAIELFADASIYYYSITFDGQNILHEYLAKSKSTEDELIFEREMMEEKQEIRFYPEYLSNEKNRLFAEVLAEKLISSNESLLSFLSAKYAKEFPDVTRVADWFKYDLVVIRPDARPGAIANILDTREDMKTFANEFLPSLNTGVTNIEVVRENLVDKLDTDMSEVDETLIQLIEKIKDLPDGVIPVSNRSGDELSLVKEGEKIVIKKLVTNHRTISGKNIPFNVSLESDGTRRLIDYIPAFQDIIHKGRVYIIDEIERSIHPLTIKEIVRKISHDPQARGQMIFTTHESNLLDQDILRTDEIWFAQKDVGGASRLYSLSDYKVHSTINIENGYLNGRYGGIPFLSNLRDLNWNKDEISE